MKRRDYGLFVKSLHYNLIITSHCHRSTPAEQQPIECLRSCTHDEKHNRRRSSRWERSTPTTTRRMDGIAYLLGPHGITSPRRQSVVRWRWHRKFYHITPPPRTAWSIVSRVLGALTAPRTETDRVHLVRPSRFPERAAAAQGLFSHFRYGD